MKTTKISLKTIQGRLTRNEMRDIMAGSDGIACAKKDEECPSPFGQYDGCCGTCNTANARPGQKFYCIDAA
jgi:hypothetical protein